MENVTFLFRLSICYFSLLSFAQKTNRKERFVIQTYCRFLCLGKKAARKGKGKGEGGEGGGGEPVDKHPEATFPPSCNYPADHLSVGKIVICQLISRVSKSWENY